MKVGKSILKKIFEKRGPTVEFRHFWKQTIFEISDRNFRQEVIRQNFPKNGFADPRGSFCTNSQLNWTKIAFCALFDRSPNFVTRHGTNLILKNEAEFPYFPKITTFRPAEISGQNREFQSQNKFFCPMIHFQNLGLLVHKEVVYLHIQ